jgi:hypothetical protein
MFKGVHHVSLRHLRRAVSAHRAVMLGIATHAEKERVKREQEAAARRANEAISGPFKGSGQPV